MLFGVLFSQQNREDLVRAATSPTRACDELKERLRGIVYVCQGAMVLKFYLLPFTCVMEASMVDVIVIHRQLFPWRKTLSPAKCFDFFSVT